MNIVFPFAGTDTVLFIPIITCTVSPSPLQFKDNFYTDMWQTWSEITYKELCSIDEICNQCICNNSRIRIDCRPIVKKEWTNKNLFFIKDILTDKELS